MANNETIGSYGASNRDLTLYYGDIDGPIGESPSTSGTQLVLNVIGKKSADFGKAVMKNFYWTLENFAGPVSPPNPAIGQLWFEHDPNVNETLTGSLKVCFGIEVGSGGELIGKWRDISTPAGLVGLTPSKIADSNETTFVSTIESIGTINLESVNDIVITPGSGNLIINDGPVESTIFADPGNDINLASDENSSINLQIMDLVGKDDTSTELSVAKLEKGQFSINLEQTPVFRTSWLAGSDNYSHSIVSTGGLELNSQFMDDHSNTKWLVPQNHMIYSIGDNNGNLEGGYTSDDKASAIMFNITNPTGPTGDGYFSIITSKIDTNDSIRKTTCEFTLSTDSDHFVFKKPVIFEDSTTLNDISINTLNAIDGTHNDPSISFSSETTLGLYRSAAGELSLTTSGTQDTKFYTVNNGTDFSVVDSGLFTSIKSRTDSNKPFSTYFGVENSEASATTSNNDYFFITSKLDSSEFVSIRPFSRADGSGGTADPQTHIHTTADEFHFNKRVATNETLSAKHLSLSDGSAAILFDGAPDDATFNDHTKGPLKRITCNDGGGNFNLWSGGYYNSSEQYINTGDGASKISLGSDGIKGFISMKVAPTGNEDDTISWAQSLTLTTSGLKLNNKKVLTEEDLPEEEGNPNYNGYTILPGGIKMLWGRLYVKQHVYGWTTIDNSITFSSPFASDSDVYNIQFTFQNEYRENVYPLYESYNGRDYGTTFHPVSWNRNGISHIKACDTGSDGRKVGYLWWTVIGKA